MERELKGDEGVDEWIVEMGRRMGLGLMVGRDENGFDGTPTPCLSITVDMPGA